MKNKMLFVLVLFSSGLLQMGCISPQKTIPDATIPRADFRIRDPFVLAEDGIYYLYESKPWDGGRGVFVRMSTDFERWHLHEKVVEVRKPPMI